MHFPFPTYSNKVLSEGLQEAYELGLTRAVGVCNFSGEQMKEMHGLLADKGIPLASNQVRMQDVMIPKGIDRQPTFQERPVCRLLLSDLRKQMPCSVVQWVPVLNFWTYR